MDADGVTRLRGIIARLARQLNASSTREGLTPSQASVLALVVHRGPLSLAELADLEGLNPTMLSRVVGRLLELELVRRIPDPADLRSASVVSTPAGQEIDCLVKAQRAAVVSEWWRRRNSSVRRHARAAGSGLWNIGAFRLWKACPASSSTWISTLTRRAYFNAARYVNAPLPELLRRQADRLGRAASCSQPLARVGTCLWGGTFPREPYAFRMLSCASQVRSASGGTARRWPTARSAAASRGRC
jgi:DNA-binding MarR family transcriptional regulator